MSDKTIPFVITDRRKFTSEGVLRPDADPSPPKHREALPDAIPSPVTEMPRPQVVAPSGTEAEMSDPTAEPGEGEIPPAPTAEQMEQTRLAYDATADRLEIAVRAANPGVEHAPPMSFEQLVQSVYMQAILQLGGGTQEGQQPEVDILGAKQSIEMLTVLLGKTEGNLSPAEASLIANAVFELRLAFLEVTQALARSAQQRATPPLPGAGGPRPGPSIVR